MTDGANDKASRGFEDIPPLPPTSARADQDPRGGVHFWPLTARRVVEWAAQVRAELRDTCMILPGPGLLDAARRAFAAAGGWQPRIETLDTLARSLAAPEAAAPGVMSGDELADRLNLAALLRASQAPDAVPLADARLLDAAVGAVHQAACELLRAAAAVPPARRAAFWKLGRELLGLRAGPGGVEHWLARVALEWAASAPAPATDRLYEHGAAAWVFVSAGGVDARAAALAGHHLERGASVVQLKTDADPADPFAALFDESAAGLAHLSDCVAVDAEAEAWSAARAVVDALRRHPAGAIALVALDRERVRRCAALLARAGVALIDEAGWRVSTTRAATRVMALLRVWRADARRDDWLAWLKSDPTLRSPPGSDEPGAAIVALERLWRGQPVGATERARAEALLAEQRTRLREMAQPPERPLAHWLAALRDAALPGRDDPAERAVAEALRLDEVAAVGSTPSASVSAAGWHGLAHGTRIDLADFTRWVDAALERAVYLPPAAPGARVFVTPLAHVALRPFVAAVCPGADERRLGAHAPSPGLLDERTARALGVADTALRRERELLAFEHLLRVPEVRFVHAAADGAEALAPSPWLQRLDHEARQRGVPGLRRCPDEPPSRRVESRPVEPPLPRAAEALPASFSASQIEALRECPYRFFAQSVLRLRAGQELDQEPGKRDYGTWLHETLHRFHRDRRRPFDIDRDLPALRHAAEQARAAQGLDSADLLPFEAGLEAFYARYLQWQYARDAQGWCWREGEVELAVSPPELAGFALKGRIDRIDRRGAQVQIVDYKTGQPAELKARVKDVAEETQLAFYTLLWQAREGLEDVPAEALYLTLEPRDGLAEVTHPDPARGAELLLRGVAQALTQVRDGAPLRALGEASACERCDARGLCRRDHWSPT